MNSATVIAAPGLGDSHCAVGKLCRSQTVPKHSKRPSKLMRLLVLLRLVQPRTPLLDPETLNDHWLRDLGLADGRAVPRCDRFRH